MWYRKFKRTGWSLESAEENGEKKFPLLGGRRHKIFKNRDFWY